MKTKLTLLIVLLSLIFIGDGMAQAPSWAWAKSAGGVSNDYGNAVCTDANGNVYVTGTFQGSSITFGSNTLYNVATGSLDIFIVKYDASGNVLWAKSGGGTSTDYVYGICTDSNGNAYITGYFRSASISFGAITLTNLDITIASYDIFITKYDSVGNVLWSKNEPNHYNQLSFAICSDASNNVYITGSFGNNANFIIGNDTLNNNYDDDIFIAKYDANGNAIWARSAGGTGLDKGYGISTDAGGNVYITGYFQQSATFGNITITGNCFTNVFIAKYNAIGNVIWAKSANGISCNSCFGKSVISDANGNTYLTGSFQSSIIFGNDTIGNAGNYGIFTAKYDTNGNALWARTPGGTGSDFGNSITTNINGNIFATGYYSSSFLNFGGIPIVNANIGYTDIFVAEYDASGNAIWATGIGDQDNDLGMGVCSSPDGSVYLTGYFGSYALNFGNTTVTNNGSYDTYLAKLDFPTGIADASTPLSTTSIYPNPASYYVTIKTNSTKKQIITISDITGKIIYTTTTLLDKTTINTSNFAQGVYAVQVQTDDSVRTNKLIIQ